MRLTLLAVGRARSGPERDLVTDYLGRAERVGRTIGLAQARLLEVESRGSSTPASEAVSLAKACPRDARIICCDERGKSLSSPELAGKIGAWRDAGCRDAVFIIGGADGLDPGFLATADLVLSFGRLVWPHLLARAMAAEQLYRCASILAGTPYHRE